MAGWWESWGVRVDVGRVRRQMGQREMGISFWLNFGEFCIKYSLNSSEISGGCQHSVRKFLEYTQSTIGRLVVGSQTSFNRFLARNQFT